MFQEMSPGMARDIFHYMRTEQKDVYHTAIGALAAQRKLRPVFVTKKRPEDQYAWLHKCAQMKYADGIDENILQMWLLKARQEMLVTFLDEAGVEHDGEGGVDDLPEELDADKVKAAVEALLAAHPSEEVALYLHVFQMQRSEGWPEITDILENDERVTLAPATA